MSGQIDFFWRTKNETEISRLKALHVCYDPSSFTSYIQFVNLPPILGKKWAFFWVPCVDALSAFTAAILILSLLEISVSFVSAPEKNSVRPDTAYEEVWLRISARYVRELEIWTKCVLHTQCAILDR